MSYDKLRDEVLAAIAKSGKCYANEARAMALELQGLRAGKADSKEDVEQKIAQSIWKVWGQTPMTPLTLRTPCPHMRLVKMRDGKFWCYQCDELVQP